MPVMVFGGYYFNTKKSSYQYIEVENRAPQASDGNSHVFFATFLGQSSYHMRWIFFNMTVRKLYELLCFPTVEHHGRFIGGNVGRV